MLAAIPLVSSAVSSLLGSSQAASATQSLQAVQSTSGAGGDFSSMMAQLANGTVDSLNTSEKMSVAGMSGKATTQSVVEAVMQAQEALQTAVAVRDKAVSAFQEVTRMSI
ncbi:MAG: flagellar hook-basal body complex protein FliE [Beijerinckiaceae bacterium]|jgi:flagellar hook-basal body complex protein FliE